MWIAGICLSFAGGWVVGDNLLLGLGLGFAGCGLLLEFHLSPSTSS